MTEAYLSVHGNDIISGGYRIIPIRPGTKAPADRDWPSICADASILQRWLDDGKGSWGIGILGEKTPGIDIDTTDAGMLAKLTKWCTDNIGPAPQRIGRAPRALLLYRSSHPFRRFKSRSFVSPDGERHQVEIIASGGQFVAYATHPVTGKPYEWPNGSPLEVHSDLLAEITEQKARGLVAYFESIVPAHWSPVQNVDGDGAEHEGNPRKTAPIAFVQSAMASIPNGDLHYDDWIRVGLALRGATAEEPEEGRSAFHEWSARSTKFDLAETDRAWDSFTDVRAAGAGTLFHLAEQHGWRRPVVPAAEEFGPLDFDVPPPTPEQRAKIQEAAADRRKRQIEQLRDVAGAAANRVALARGFHLLSLAESCEMALDGGPKFLIEGVMEGNSLAVIYGKPNDGKTFVAIDMAAAIASGQTWNNRPTVKGSVVYVACEGGYGIHKRIAAVVEGRGLPLDTPFRLAPCVVDLLDPKASLQSIIDAANTLAAETGYPCQLIVIDTLNRAFGGGDENAGPDMGRFFDNAGRIRESTGAAVMIIHHSGKDVARGSRGHSSLKGTVDTEIEVSWDGRSSTRVLRNTKQRDGERFSDIQFELQQVSLGTDSDGRGVKSCVVHFPNSADFGPLPLSKTEARFKESLFAAIATKSGALSATDIEWDNAYCLAVDPAWQGDGRPKGCSAERTRKLRRSLIESGHVKQIGGEFAPLQEKSDA